jgi:Protein of unknown function (DUF3631)
VTIAQWSPDQGKGIDDFLALKSDGSTELSKLLAASVPLSGILRSVDLEIVELELCRSHLKSTTIEQICRAVAKPLGVRAGTLLDEVAGERGRQAIAETRPLPPNVVPRPLPELLASLMAVLNRYVIFPFPDEQAAVIALWIIHSWLFAAADYTPYLSVYSPIFRSGKSRLFEVLEVLCRNAQLSFSATSASLLRITTETDPPTFLLDELDTVFTGRTRGPETESLRQFFNAGFKRGARFLRCVFKGKEIIVQEFPAFSQKALATNKQCLPSTVTDRAVPIELERQGKRKAERKRDREYRQSVQSLRDEMEVLSLDQELLETLRKARPAMPDQLNDRQQDICEPLLAIADLAGDWITTDAKTGKEITVKWPEKARAALIKLYGRQEEEPDVGVRLLHDIKQIFDESGESALFTEELLKNLVEISDDAPWAHWFEEDIKKDRLQSAASRLARQLKHYHIKPKTVWKDDNTAKGYSRDQFEKAWERYLTPEIICPSVNSVSSRQVIRNSDNPQAEKELQPDGSAVLRGENCPSRQGNKPLSPSEITPVPDDLTAKMQDQEGENKIPPKSGQSDPPLSPEERAKLQEIKETFNAIGPDPELDDKLDKDALRGDEPAPPPESQSDLPF